MQNITEIVPGGTLRRVLNARGVAKYSYFGPAEGYTVSRKRCKIWSWVQLMTNRK